MHTKRIAIIAIIATLPFAANADNPIGPAHVNNFGNATVATYAAPYAIANIGEHDDEHIATTAYVKGAYNDTIAAINNIGRDMNNKQDELQLDYEGDRSDVEPAGKYILTSLEHVDNADNNDLITAGAVKNAIDSVNNTITNKRVEIYTTWGVDDGTATTLVPFATAQ